MLLKRPRLKTDDKKGKIMKTKNLQVVRTDTGKLTKPMGGMRVCREETVKGKKVTIFMDREIMNLSPEDKREVIHLNRDPYDCRRPNLLVVESKEKAESYLGLCPHCNKTIFAELGDFVEVVDMDEEED